MIGIFLLLIALVCYFRKNTRWLSYVLYIGFLSKGYIVLIDSVIGVKNQDMAIVYTFVIGIFLLFNHRLKFPNHTFSLWLKVFMVFIVCCALFSILYYGFTPFQVLLQGARGWLLIFCVPIFIRMSRRDFDRVIKVVSYITLITSVIYIAQIVLSRAILPYDLEVHFVSSIGLIRIYNFPPFLSFFLVLSFVYSKFFPTYWLWRIVFFTALICTLGRTMIFSSILAIFICMWLQGNAGRLVKIGIALLILLIPFLDIVTERFEGGSTGIDLQNVSRGTYNKYVDTSGGTMTFRIALLNERVEYLIHRSFYEQFFGMGLVLDNPLVHQKYHFRIGLVNLESGRNQQLHSPDIAWVNTICTLGFGGTAIYLAFLISMTIYFFRRRKLNIFYSVATAMLLCGYIDSFAGSTVSEFRYLAIYFAIMSTSYTYIRSNKLTYSMNGRIDHIENSNCEPNKLEV